MKDDRDLSLHTNPSSDDGLLLYWLATLIARMTNSHMHFDLKDIPEVERNAEVLRLKAWMEELLH